MYVGSAVPCHGKAYFPGDLVNEMRDHGIENDILASGTEGKDLEGSFQ